MSNYAELIQNTMVKLHMTDHMVYLRANQILKQHGITMQQAMILQYLFRADERKINQKDLEVFLGISNPSVTSLMKTMVAKRLIRRLPDRSDARSYLLYITPRALELRTVVTQALEQIHAEFCAGLTEQEMMQLYAILEKIHLNFA